MRSPFRALRPLLVLLPLVAAACATVPPPAPAPEPVPEFKPAEIEPPKPPEPPQQFVTVTGSKVNLRSGPDTKQPIVGTAKKGDRLRMTAPSGDWYELRLDDGRTAFINAKLVKKEEPCLPDMLTPQVISTPTMDLTTTDHHGLIQLRVHVSATGDVTDVKVQQNDTGDRELETKAIADARSMKFVPLVRKCKAISFVYLMNRTY